MGRPRQKRIPLPTRAAALLAVLLVAALTVLSASPELHQWVHGHGLEAAPAAHPRSGGAPDDDDDGCVVTLFAQGLVLPVAMLALAFTGRVLRLIGFDSGDRPTAAHPRYLLLPSQAPPLGTR
jgi:hypothetical protein